MTKSSSKIVAMSCATLGALALMTVGCGRYVAPVIPPTGGAFTRIEGPLDLNSQGGKVIGPLSGESESVAWLGFWATGDASIATAAREGGIKRINHVDYRYRSFLWGFKAVFTTVVYGEGE